MTAVTAAPAHAKSNGHATTAEIPTTGYELLRIDQVDVGENVRIQLIEVAA